MGLLVAPFIAMKANQIRSRGGGSNIIPTIMIRPAALEAARTTNPTRSFMLFITLTTVAPSLMAFRSRVEYLGPLDRTLKTWHKIWLPLFLYLQINLPLPSSCYHILQRLVAGSAQILPNITPQHLMIPSLIHLQSPTYYGTNSALS